MHAPALVVPHSATCRHPELGQEPRGAPAPRRSHRQSMQSVRPRTSVVPKWEGGKMRAVENRSCGLRPAIEPRPTFKAFPSLGGILKRSGFGAACFVQGLRLILIRIA